jgi:hypothetical protein
VGLGASGEDVDAGPGADVGAGRETRAKDCWVEECCGAPPPSGPPGATDEVVRSVDTGAEVCCGAPPPSGPFDAAGEEVGPVAEIVLEHDN